MSIPVLDPTALMRALHQEFLNAFRDVFVIGDNATLQCRNSDIPRFTEFINRYVRFCVLVSKL